MTLYHGSSQIVREPRIIQPKRTLDYGAGFYTTTSEKQAHDWALRRIVGDERGYVNVYEFDEVAASGLKRLEFANPPVKIGWISCTPIAICAASHTTTILFTVPWPTTVYMPLSPFTNKDF